MDTKEMIEELKKLYEGCQVYFDIQEKSLVIKHSRTKEDKQKEPEEETKLRRIRTNLQILRSRGETDLPEPPPASVEELYGNGACKFREAYFQLIITKLDEW